MLVVRANLVMRIFLLLILLSFNSTFIVGQTIDQEKDSLDGIYIPTDLEDAFKQIDSFWSDSTKQMVANWSEDEFSAKAHMGFGLWMRNNWGLWRGSRLSKYFNDKGIYHPDDMSGILLDSYHRYLNNKDLELDKQIKSYINYWKKAEKEQAAERKEDFKAFVVGDTVEFNYNFGFLTEEQETHYDEDSCYAKGVILEKSKKSLELLIKLIDACNSAGIISLKYDKHDTQTNKIIERDIKEIMKVGDKKWMNYQLWDY